MVSSKLTLRPLRLSLLTRNTGMVHHGTESIRINSQKREEHPSQDLGLSEVGMLGAGLHLGAQKSPQNYSNLTSTHPSQRRESCFPQFLLALPTPARRLGPGRAVFQSSHQGALRTHEPSLCSALDRGSGEDPSPGAPSWAEGSRAC